MRRFGPRLLAAAVLLLLTFGVYAGSLRNGFTKFDDLDYVLENPRVQSGLTLTNARWALTSTERGNWHPLTWLSHQLDVRLFGLDARGHHVTSLLLHGASTLLLFQMLTSLGGGVVTSALVAALFAVHPLHVESVAWVAARKDVLSGFCFMLVLQSYLLYLRRPGLGRYLLVAATFVLGLAAKQMLVTLPVLLLLLDFWPLGRFARGQSPRRPLLEKAPLFLIAAAAGAMTLRAQWDSAVGYIQDFSLGTRFANAAISAVEYLWMMFWPAKLAAFYPYGEREITWWLVTGAALILAALTLAAVRAVKRRPAYLVGWLWYLVALLPVIGLIQVGSQRMADRYTYLPLIGIFLILALGLRDLACVWPAFARPLALAASLWVLALLPVTWVQAGYWKDDFTLFGHAAAVTKNNWMAYGHLGTSLAEMGRPEEAQRYYSAAAQANSGYRFWLFFRSGGYLEEQGNIPGALDMYRKALALFPYDSQAKARIEALEHGLRR